MEKKTFLLVPTDYAWRATDFIFRKRIRHRQLLWSGVSAFPIVLQTVVCKAKLVWPSPKSFFPVQTFQRFKKQGVQDSSSGMAALAPLLLTFTPSRGPPPRCEDSLLSSTICTRHRVSSISCAPGTVPAPFHELSQPCGVGMIICLPFKIWSPNLGEFE